MAVRKVAALFQLWRWVEYEDRERLAPFVRWRPWWSGAQLVIIQTFTRTGVLDAESARRHADEGLGDALLTVDEASGVPLLDEAPYEPIPFVGPWALGDPIEPMRFQLRREVNLALKRHISMGILPPRGTIRYRPDSLLTAVYVQFALRMTGSERSKRECGNPACKQRVFAPHRRDQRYCTARCRALAAYHRRQRIP